MSIEGLEIAPDEISLAESVEQQALTEALAEAQKQHLSKRVVLLRVQVTRMARQLAAAKEEVSALQLRLKEFESATEEVV